MQLSHTKIALALMAIFASSSTLASEINFSNLSVGTITNLTTSQTGEGRSRISDGGGLTSGTVTGVATSAATGVSFTRADDAAGAFVHSGGLTTLSLTQATSLLGSGEKGNAITGSIYTAADGTGSVTVNQNGKGNVVDFAIGTSTIAVGRTPTISIIQKGNDNWTELTRTAGINTDTIASYGNSNAVKVTGSATGTNSVSLTFGSDGGAASSLNQATVSQTGFNNVFTAQVTGRSNTLDVGQSAVTSTLTLGGTGLGMTGDSNYLYVRQSGSANTATITAINGDSNKLNLIQSGAATGVTIALNGSGNNMNVTQSGDSTTASITITAATNASITVLQQTAGASFTYSGTIPDSGSITVTQ